MSLYQYPSKLSEYVEQEFGTLKQFKDEFKISHVTAQRYLKTPKVMRVDFAMRLAKRMNKSLLQIIGEGEE